MIGYSIIDSLIIAAALYAGARTLYQEDMQDGQTIDGLTIRIHFRQRQRITPHRARILQGICDFGEPMPCGELCGSHDISASSTLLTPLQHARSLARSKHRVTIGTADFSQPVASGLRDTRHG